MIKKPIEFRKKRDFGETINDTFVFARQNLKPLAGAFLIFCGFFILAGFLSMAMQQLKSVNYINGVSKGIGSFDYFKDFLGWEYILSLLFMWLSYTSLQVFVICFIKLYVEKGNIHPSREELWESVKRYFLRVLFSSIPVTFLLLLGSVLCFFPGIWLFPIVSLFYPIMIIENGSFSHSFSRMFAIIKENWWATFGILIIIWVIVYATTTFLTLPTSIMNMVKMFTHGKPTLSPTLSIITLGIQYACQIFMILPVICITFCYYSLVELKENTGLMQKIQHFGDTAAPAHKTGEEY